MQKSIYALRMGTSIGLILMTQLIIVGMLAMNLLTLGSVSVSAISQTPPVGYLYSAGDISWVGSGRTVAHLVIAIAHAVIGVYCIKYGLLRKVKVIKFTTIALGIHFWFSTFVNLTLIGLITIGGWWHILSFLGVIMLASSGTAAAVIIAMLYGKLREIGEAHDALIEEQS